MRLLTQTPPPKLKGAFKALAFELKMRAVNLMSDFIYLPQISRASMRKTGEGKTMLTGLRRGITLRSQRWDMEIRPAACQSRPK